MATVQGIREKVHLPIYDSLFVKPEKQLRDSRARQHVEVFRQRSRQDETRNQPAVGLAAAPLQHLRGSRDARRHQRSAAGVFGGDAQSVEDRRGERKFARA